MPYEVKYWNNLWVMSKAGDIPGYDSITVFIKELKIGITLGTASAVGKNFPIQDCMRSLVDIMVNAVEKVVAIAQQGEVYPPPQDQVEKILGCYFLKNFFGTNATVSVTIPGEDGREVEVSSPALGPGGIFASFRGCQGSSCMFQLDMVDSTCFVSETAAVQGQYMVFDESQSKRILYFPTMYGANDKAFFWKGSCV